MELKVQSHWSHPAWDCLPGGHAQLPDTREARRLGRFGKRAPPRAGGWDLAPGFGLPPPNQQPQWLPVYQRAPRRRNPLPARTLRNSPVPALLPRPSAPPGNGRSEVKLICLQTVTGGWMPTAQLRGITIYVSWNYSSFHCIESLKNKMT